MSQRVKNPPAKAGEVSHARSILGSRRFPGGGHGNQLQRSSLENPMYREAWWPQSMGSQRIGHDLATEHTPMHVTSTEREQRLKGTEDAGCKNEMALLPSV